MSRLKDFYREEVVKQLQEQFGYKSVMEVPRITKITLNMGVGEALTDKKVLENAVSDMEAISGQKAVVTKARKSVAGFKVRDGYYYHAYCIYSRRVTCFIGCIQVSF